jgi:hypothetical protein
MAPSIASSICDAEAEKLAKVHVALLYEKRVAEIFKNPLAYARLILATWVFAGVCRAATVRESGP